jgi:hypothetical protein
MPCHAHLTLPATFPHTLFSDIINLCPFLSVRDQVSHQFNLRPNSKTIPRYAVHSVSSDIYSRFPHRDPGYSSVYIHRVHVHVQLPQWEMLNRCEQQYHVVTLFQFGIYLKRFCKFLFTESRDSSVGIAMGYGLDDRGSRVRFPAGAGNFSLHHRVQNGSGVHPAPYPMGTRGSFPGSKAAGSWSWPLTSI